MPSSRDGAAVTRLDEAAAGDRCGRSGRSRRRVERARDQLADELGDEVADDQNRERPQQCGIQAKNTVKPRSMLLPISI